jgi:hypothetical protein
MVTTRVSHGDLEHTPEHLAYRPPATVVAHGGERTVAIARAEKMVALVVGLR